ncbi:MAG TPA: 2Fe-2S iron-sulfur cluster-binding protein [bacterium]|nr:2Fe-2S iron-sulfur cluster-binding protein [bacterium]
MIKLKINGQAVKVGPGTTVLQAAQGLGIKIPTLCHHEGLTPYGACRLCTVEINDAGRSSLQASCCYPAKEGLVVQTETPAISDGRKLLLQLLLARCSRSPAIIRLAAEWGVTATPFSPKGEECALCGLCVRACASLMKVEAIAMSGRGVSRKVTTPFGFMSEECRACGACTYVCPTGHMQMEAETVAQLRRQVGIDRKCRYMLMGLVASKLCPNNYDCAHCAFDQTMELRLGTHPAFSLAADGKAASADDEMPGGKATPSRT